MKRPTLFETFTEMARVVSKRSTCGEGRQHGAVLVLDNRYPVAFGYNGPSVGSPGCEEVCSWPDACPSVHAEVNMVVNAARLGVDFSKCVVYCTKEPCGHCAAVLKNAGVSAVHFKESTKKGGNVSRCRFPQE